MGKSMREAKKAYRPGTLITVEGTHCVFMSLGLKKNFKLDSFNGMDILTGEPVRRCDGTARPATKKESLLYWIHLRNFIKGKE